MRIAAAIIVLIVVGYSLYLLTERQGKVQNGVWKECTSKAATLFPAPYHGRAAPDPREDKAIATCFVEHGYYFEGAHPCDPAFPSRYEAPFCYVPKQTLDRVLFRIRQGYENI